MIIEEDIYFVRPDGTERHLTEIIEEQINRVTSAEMEGLTTVTDFYPGGENYHQIVVTSMMQYDLEFLFYDVGELFYIENAKGEALDRFGAQKGVFREDAEFATGNVVFTLANPLNSPLEILEGTETVTDDSIIFITTEDVTIQSGETTAVVDVLCEESGTIGNVLAGSIRNILTILPYDLSVNNPNNFTNGKDEEDDDTYKARIKDSAENYPVGTSKWVEKTAETLVSDAYYHKISPNQGKIVYKPTDGVTQSDLIKLFEKKENQIVNLDLNFQQATAKAVITTAMNMSVIIDNNFTWSVIQTKIDSEVKKYVKELSLGDLFRANMVGYLAETVEGVITVKLNGYVDVQLSNEQYATITGALAINKG